MKIVVVDFAASSGGAMTILEQYYNIAKKDKKNTYTFLLSDNYLKETDNIKIVLLTKQKKWLNRLKFDHFEGKKIINKIAPDKIISLQNTIVRGIKIPQTVYIHQSIPFQNIKKFSFLKKEERKLATIQYLIGHEIKQSAKKADSIIVQTKWMKKAIIEKCNISEKKIDIQPPKIIVKKQKNKQIIKNNLFFYPTSNAIYKNNQIIFEAVKILEKEGYNNFIIEMTIDGESTNHIKKIGRISHEEVMKKYQESILLFPSYIETIGLPLLEARNSNTIIISSDTVFAREILDGYKKVSYFNYDSPESLAALIKNIIRK